MQRLNRMLCVAAVALVTFSSAAAQKSNSVVMDKGERLGQGADILSDTQGVNFRPYLKNVLSEIRNQWATQVPVGAQPGSTEIRLSIKPDGTIAAMHMDGSTNDDLLNRLAWDALTQVGQLPPLPAKFHGQAVEMRVHFNVNQ